MKHIARILTAVLPFCLLLAVIPAGAVTYNEYKTNRTAFTKFCDVSQHWAKEDIKWVVENGLMKNNGDPAAFEPNGILTRAQMVQILYNLASASGRDMKVEHTTEFSDVKKNAWFYTPVQWAVENHVSNGTGNGCFSPNKPVTREQLATILYRYFADYCGLDLSVEKHGELTFSDLDKFSKWVDLSEILAVKNIGLFQGVDATRFDPQGKATRAQAAVLQHRMHDFYRRNPVCVAGRDLTLVWNDEFEGDTIDFEKWHYYGEFMLHGEPSKEDVKQYLRILGSRNGDAKSQYEEMVRAHQEYREKHIYQNGKGELILKVDYFDNSCLEPSASNYVHMNNVCPIGLQSEKLDQPYGYYECRAIIGNAPGVNCAIWMVAGDNKGRLTTDSMEADILESVFSPTSAKQCVLASTIHWQWSLHSYYGTHPTLGDKFFNKSGFTQKGNEYIPINFFDQLYHTYAMLWTKEEIAFFYDGIEICRTDCREWVTIHDKQGNPVVVKGRGPCQNPGYIILSNHFMAPDLLNYGYSKNSKDAFPFDFTIDYFRVYQITDYLADFEN